MQHDGARCRRAGVEGSSSLDHEMGLQHLFRLAFRKAGAKEQKDTGSWLSGELARKTARTDKGNEGKRGCSLSGHWAKRDRCGARTGREREQRRDWAHFAPEACRNWHMHPFCRSLFPPL